MTWLLILLPALVLVCILGVIVGTEQAHQRIRRQRRGARG